jgi:hypothetical protein
MDVRFPVLAVSLIAACCYLKTGEAGDETLSFNQSASGNILITLQGQIPFCDFMLGAFVGDPTVSTPTSNQIVVSSAIIEGECNPPPVPPPPQPYAFTIDAGIFSDGTYSVTWTFDDISTPAFLPPQNFMSSFVLIDGGLVIFRDGFEGP